MSSEVKAKEVGGLSDEADPATHPPETDLQPTWDDKQQRREGGLGFRV